MPPPRRRPTAPNALTLLGHVALLVSVFATPAKAETTAAHVVGLFDRLCYANMPDIDEVEALAMNAGWEAVTGGDLDAYRPTAEPESLKAWRFSEEGSNFSLAVTRSAMDDQAKADFPDFADAANVACSLVLTSTEAASAAVGAELEKLVERKPDTTYDEGPFGVSAWSGGNDQLQVHLYHYAPKSGAPGGLLSMTVFQNP